MVEKLFKVFIDRQIGFFVLFGLIFDDVIILLIEFFMIVFKYCLLFMLMECKKSNFNKDNLYIIGINNVYFIV